jgi:hypothetical protein
LVLGFWGFVFVSLFGKGEKKRWRNARKRKEKRREVLFAEMKTENF